MKKPLIIGYGNSLREDDGIGPRAAELVRRALAPDAAGIVQCHQLTPELALEVEGASLVIFLDAALNQSPSDVVCTEVHKAEPSAWCHELSPEQLLGLIEEAPAAYAITCGISNTAWREGLTAQGEHWATRMAAAALRLLHERKPRGAVPATGTNRPARLR
jgi:hydrogenase maturation protease